MEIFNPSTAVSSPKRQVNALVCKMAIDLLFYSLFNG
jgi:hypothetical protein